LPADISQKARFEYFLDSLLKARLKNLPATVPFSPKTLFKFTLDDCPIDGNLVIFETRYYYYFLPSFQKKK
jgi:hypothetical protein